MARPDQTLNLQHLDNPLEGDYWHEMCCVYHVVLKVLTNGNLVIANRQKEKDGQWFDFKNAHEITKAEHTKLVRYKGIDGFVADVVVASTPGMAAVSEWRDMYLGKYKSVADRDIVGPAATVEEIREALDLTQQSVFADMSNDPGKGTIMDGSGGDPEPSDWAQGGSFEDHF